MGLDAQVSRVTSCVKNGEDRRPLDVVHACRRVVHPSFSAVRGALYVEMGDFLTVVRKLGKVIVSSVVGVGAVVFQHQVGKLRKKDVPLWGRNDEIVPVAVFHRNLDPAVCPFKKFSE